MKVKTMKIKWSTILHIDGRTEAERAASPCRALVSSCGRWAIAPTFTEGVYRLLDKNDLAAWDESGFPSKDHPFPLGTIAHLKRLVNEASEEATPNKFTLTKASDITPEAGGPDDIFGKAKAAGAITGSSEEWGRIRREWNAARIRTVTDSDKT
jgi:hypothetical protein